MNGYETYYRVLELSQDADRKDIKKAYHRLSLKYHPDQNKSHESALKFIKIKEAYDILIKKPMMYRGVVDTSKLSPAPQNNMSFMEALYGEHDKRAHRYRRKDDIEISVSSYRGKRNKRKQSWENRLDKLAGITTNIVSFLLPFAFLSMIVYIIYLSR